MVDGRRILIVDDSDDTCMLLGRLLRTRGHDVRTAADGEAALALLASFTPDIAILDIGLPVMDGYELARRLRERLGSLRLIALSGYSGTDDRARSRDAGFEHHLVKPVDVKRLVATLV